MLALRWAVSASRVFKNMNTVKLAKKRKRIKLNALPNDYFAEKRRPESTALQFSNNAPPGKNMGEFKKEMERNECKSLIPQEKLNEFC